MKTHKVRNSLLLLLTALIWGTAFVAQSVGMDYVGPFTYSCVRSLIAGIMLIPCIAFLNKVNPNQEEKEICRDESRRKAYQKKTSDRRNLLRTGPWCGKLSSADWDSAYDGRKSRIYYDLLYYHCTDYRTVL